MENQLRKLGNEKRDVTATSGVVDTLLAWMIMNASRIWRGCYAGRRGSCGAYLSINWTGKAVYARAKTFIA